MAEHPIAVTASAGAISAGQAVQPGNWAAGFDHAALVAALRSRADGFDFWLRHAATGALVALNQTGVNTTSCKLAFLIHAEIANGATDYYTLTTGNLATQVTPFTAIAPAGSGSASITITALRLPEPGYPFERHEVRDTRVAEGLSPRFGVGSENARAKLRCNWPSISAEEYYELRAAVHSVRGGAGKLTAPSWLPSLMTSTAAKGGVIITDAQFSQISRNHYSASMVLEEVVA